MTSNESFGGQIVVLTHIVRFAAPALEGPSAPRTAQCASSHFINNVFLIHFALIAMAKSNVLTMLCLYSFCVFVFVVVLLDECLSDQLALRVSPAVTRLTVYRWLHIMRPVG